ncbi:ATP-binding protein [Gammaproteobacteria bacterium]|nr:ATP-binding protein [Gammaproteobacteria bacterium]MDA9568726.1 ATP-binding protein [Gammaproteobacteria bacterium]MDB2483755.1 ATP-binding protein [Gammaproteobacteria bacterium]
MIAKHKQQSSLLALIAPLEDSEASPNRIALQRLLQLRAFVTVIGLLGLAILLPFSSIKVPPSAIIGLLIGVAASLVIGFWRLRSAVSLLPLELLGHLLADVVLLILLLTQTGGISNPLISYLLVLLAVSATILPRLMVLSFAAGSIAIYTFFLLIDLSSGQQMSMGSEGQAMTFQLHLVGMWVIFVVSAALITAFVTRMAEGIRAREINLAHAREEALRSEQLIAIGTLAAGTAHALGTPLSTMAVLLGELDSVATENLASPEVKEDISVLRQQVTRCRNSLTQLTRYYHKDEGGGASKSLIADFIEDIREYLVNIHPTSNIRFELQDTDKKQLTSDPSIKHAVINIIENGIKAARTEVSVSAKILTSSASGNRRQELIELIITDDGPGIPDEVMENLGEPFISIRNQGMGLGIYLANASIQRLGGTIEMSNVTGGARTRITLPIEPLPLTDSAVRGSTR